MSLGRGLLPRGGQGLLLPLRLALRDLSGGVGGFAVLIASLALGVMAIAGVGLVGDSLQAALLREGRELIGGDIVLWRMHARADPGERAQMAKAGATSETASLRTIARRPDGQEGTLTELKGVDEAYPLAGKVRLAKGALGEAIRTGNAIVVEPALLERLNVKVGERIKVGSAELTIAGLIEQESDALSSGIAFGPRAIVSIATLEATGLVEPGSLIRWRYAFALPGGVAAGEEEGTAAVAQLGETLKGSGFSVVKRSDPTPGLRRSLDRFRSYLTLAALAALIIGGLGAANAASAFLERKRESIATMKSLGATSGVVMAALVSEITLIAAVGVAIGLALGIGVPLVGLALAQPLLPAPVALALRLPTLALAAAAGFLVALLFSVGPLARAERMSPATLFRPEAPWNGIPRTGVMVALAVLALLLVGLIVLTVGRVREGLIFVAATATVLGAFFAIGGLVRRAAGRIPRPQGRPALAVALGNVAAGDGLTRQVVLSLGAGLTLLTAVALAGASLKAELDERLPGVSPAFFVLDVGKGDLDDFKRAVEAEAPGTRIETTPMLRGRITALNGVGVDARPAKPGTEWALSGDRGISFAAEVPKGSKVVAGTWWSAEPPAGEAPAEVSLDSGLARDLDLKVGDSITVNVLGRDITARVSNLRDVDWESMGLSFVMLFPPRVLAGAPYHLVAALTLPEGRAGPAQEAGLERVLSRRFPSMTPIRVKAAIEAFKEVVGRLMTGIEVAGAFTLVLGTLVLAGAFGAARRRRLLQTVILKALGATRGRILLAHALEYAVLALAATLGAVVLGSIAAYLVAWKVLETPFVIAPGAVVQSLLIALMVVGGLGLASTFTLLRKGTTEALRAEA